MQQVSIQIVKPPNNVTYVVLLQERLRVVVAVNENLGHGIEDSRVLAARLHTSLQPRENKLQAVALLDLMNKLINGEIPSDRCK
jgi:hypothetical protein